MAQDEGAVDPPMHELRSKGLKKGSISLIGAISYEVLKRREEAAAERAKERAKLAERGDAVPAAQPA